MAARFPQGTGALAYRIKPAWASKIYAIYWAVAADMVQRLYPGDTVTAPITRATSGAGFDSTNGRITGNNTSTYFTDEKSGGIGGLKESDNFVIGAVYHGDMFNGAGTWVAFGSREPPDTFDNGFKLKAETYHFSWKLNGGGSYQGGAASNDVPGWMSLAIRHDQADAIEDVRAWAALDAASAVELTSKRAAASGSSTQLIGGTGAPIYFGATAVGTGNTSASFECCYIGAVLSDADMAAIADDPSIVLELASGGAAELEGAALASAAATGDLTTQAAVKGVRVQLSSGAESLTGLAVRWWDDPDASGAPDYEADDATTDAGRWLELDLSGVTALGLADLGYLLVTKPGVSPDDDLVAGGRVPVADIS